LVTAIAIAPLSIATSALADEHVANTANPTNVSMQRGQPSNSLRAHRDGDSDAQAPRFVRDVDNPATEPFQSFLCWSEGTMFTQCPPDGNTFTIPSSTSSGATVKRFVFEYLSGSCQSGPGIAITGVYLIIPAGGVGHNVVPVNVTAYPNLENDYAFAQQTRLYANPGQTVQIGISRIGGPIDTCIMSFSGYFVTQ
jgi:hypothetical protein